MFYCNHKQQSMPQQVHLGTWLNNKCNLLCFLFTQPGRPWDIWSGGGATEQSPSMVLNPEDQKGSVLTLHSGNTVWMLTWQYVHT